MPRRRGPSDVIPIVADSRKRCSMTAPIRVRPLLVSFVVLALVLGSLAATMPGVATAADTPRRGGVLLALLGADPPRLDHHPESTLPNIELVAPLYTTLLQL